MAVELSAQVNLEGKQTPKVEEANKPGLLKPEMPFLVADRAYTPVWEKHNSKDDFSHVAR